MAARFVRRAIIPAAEISTGLLPATKAVPKELLPVVDRPLIQYAVEEAFASGIEDIVIVTGRGKGAIEDHFDRAPELEDTLCRNGLPAARDTIKCSAARPGAVAYIRQQEPLGLAHALWCARQAIGDEPFAVLFPDDVFLANPPCLAQLMAVYPEIGGNVAAVVPPARDRAARYGVFAAKRRGDRPLAMTRLPTQPTLPGDPTLKWAAVGRFILDSAFLERLQPSTVSGAVTLADALAAAAGDGTLSGHAVVGRHFNCNDTLGLLEANLAFALARPDLAGATRNLLARHARRAEPAAARSVETPGLAVSA